MRTAIFGGTFDPLHWGHIRIAQISREEMQLDRIFLVPAGRPPHKSGQFADSAHRYEMCRLAAEKYGFDISDYEIKKQEHCYTADTMEHFSKEYEELFFIAGGDSIVSMHKWKEPERIFKQCGIIAALRSNSDKELAKKNLAPYHARIFWINNPMIDISSTQIRCKIQQGEAISGCVPPEVEEYIIQNKLYR